MLVEVWIVLHRRKIVVRFLRSQLRGDLSLESWFIGRRGNDLRRVSLRRFNLQTGWCAWQAE